MGGITAEDIKTGRVASLTKPDVARTTIMKLATVSTLWDYVRRAMPWNAPKSLTTDDVSRALAIADHHHGYSPAFGQGGFRGRVRLLARLDDIAKLIAWYAR